MCLRNDIIARIEAIDRAEKYNFEAYDGLIDVAGDQMHNVIREDLGLMPRVISLSRSIRK